MNISESSIIYTSTSQMQEICAPLFKNKHIKYFEYVRLYKNGKAIKLDTHSEVLPYILKNNLYLKPHEIIEFSSYIFMSSILPKSNKNIYTQVIADYRNYFNLDHFFFLIKKKVGYIEVFVFGADKDNGSVIDYYLNNIDVLDLFSIYFVDKAKDLIRRALKEKILFNEWRCFYNNSNGNGNYVDGIHICKPKYLYFINEATKKEISVTYREFECITQYLGGKSSKNIAKDLHLSPRTVEAHILNIRRKLDCITRDEIINILKKNGYDKFIHYFM